MRPAMREETVTNRKPKIDDQHGRDAGWRRAPVGAPGTGLKVRKRPHHGHDHRGAGQHQRHREVLRRAAHRRRRAAVPALAQVGRARAQGGHDGGQRLDEGDEPGRRHRARADVADVVLPELVGRHLGDGDRARVDRRRHQAAEELDGRHHDQPGEHAAREDHARDLRADDVADPEVLGGDGRAQRGAGHAGRVVGRRLAHDGERVRVLEQRVDAAQAEPVEDAAREAPRPCPGDRARPRRPCLRGRGGCRAPSR